MTRSPTPPPTATAAGGGVGDRVIQAGVAGALDRLSGSGGLDRGGVDQHDVVPKARALARQGAHHLLDLIGQAGAALVKARLADQPRKQVSELLASPLGKAPIRR